jgi:hypothetical protein
MPKLPLLAAAVLLLLSTGGAYAQSAPVHHLVEVRTTGPAQMQRLLALNLDLASCTPPLRAQRRVEVIATDRDLATLRAGGFAFAILQPNLEAFYAAEAARFPVVPSLIPALGQGAMGGHWTLAEMEAILDSLHAQNPAICAAKVSIGSSLENRPIWMVKISDNVGVDENEPEVMFDALHHAREPLSMEATLVFMDWLVRNYGTDPLATFLVDERELYFVPCVNPDGYEYNRTTNPGGGGLWRKNRRPNGDGTFGVDINRNYGTGWSAPNGGNSTITSDETYRGTAPFSEPETQVLDAFVQSRHFVTTFSTHTYQDVLLRPWGWQLGDPPNVADYNALGSYFVQENGILHGSISNLLYIAAGNAVDHNHVVHGAIAFTAELGRSNEGGFWPAGPAITDIATRHQPMFRKIALTAGPALQIDAVTVAEAAGGNGNGTVEPGESGTVVVTVRDLGIAASPANLTLQAVSAGVTVGTGSFAFGTIARLSAANNAATPFTFTVAAGTTDPAVTLRLTLTGDGRTQTQDLQVALVPERVVVTDDMERDRGFSRAPGGTATTGLWERASPQQTLNGTTVIQPGTQTTPGGSNCQVTDHRAGTSAGSFDVDGGFTDLWSPVMDLRHLPSAKVAMQLWYAESVGDDAMQIDVSRDGGTSWSPLYSRSTSTGAWLPLELPLGAPLTDRMRIRWRAQDLNPSLVECLVDDFAIKAPVANGSVTLLGSGVLGTVVEVAMHDVPGAACFPLAATALGPGVTFPGVGGVLLLDPAATTVLPLLVADSAGRAVFELALPAVPAFHGTVLYWQLASLSAAGLAFGGNSVAVTLQ